MTPHPPPPESGSPTAFARLPAPGRVLIACLTVIALLAGAYGATQYYRHRVAPGLVEAARASAANPATIDAQAILNPRGLVRQFDLDAEANLPTAWSSLQLLSAAGLLAMTWRHRVAAHMPLAGFWGALSAGFLLLAVDEVVGIHNHLYVAADDLAARKARGVFYYSWVVPALAVVCVVGVISVRFLWRLPRRTGCLFMLAGAAYVAAAIGGEMLMGWLIAEGAAGRRLVAVGAVACEELGEMTAIALFLYGVLDYMRREGIALVAGYPHLGTTATADPSSDDAPLALHPPDRPTARAA